MTAFLLRRALLGTFTCVAISMLAFTIIVAPPGDFASFYAAELGREYGIDAGSPQYAEMEAGLRAAYNRDQSVAVQYVRWGWNVLRGDLGMSLEHKRPVAEVMGARLFMTILLAVTTIVFTWIMAIPIGIYSAVRQHSMGDYAVTLIGFLGLAVPDFLLGLILLWLVYDRFGVLLDGLFSSQYYSAPWSLGRLWDLMKHIWIPALVLGTSGTAALIRVLRNNLLDELRKPYVTTARAKGVPEWRLVVKYPVRVALGPLISTAAFILPAMLSGTIIVSVVLNLPTLGPVLLQALLTQDTYLAATSVMFLGMFTVAGVLLSDMLLALTDPRARLETT